MIKNYSYKTVFIFGFIVFLLSQQTYGQETPKYVNLNDILVKLTFTSRISRSTEEINAQLIKDIQARQVDFVLSSENEAAIRKAGGNDLLIKEIHANVAKIIKKKRERLPGYDKYCEEADNLYQKFTDNYKGGLEQKRTAIQAAKEFIKKYGDEKNIKEEFREKFKEDYKDILIFLERQIQKLGTLIMLL